MAIYSGPDVGSGNMFQVLPDPPATYLTLLNSGDLVEFYPSHVNLGGPAFLSFGASPLYPIEANGSTNLSAGALAPGVMAFCNFTGLGFTLSDPIPAASGSAPSPLPPPPPTSYPFILTNLPQNYLLPTGSSAVLTLTQTVSGALNIGVDAFGQVNGIYRLTLSTSTLNQAYIFASPLGSVNIPANTQQFIITTGTTLKAVNGVMSTDTTTPWTSLGTFVFPAATNGAVLVERLL